jgi:hypothetical protein
LFTQYLLIVARNWSSVKSTILRIKARATTDMYSNVETSMSYPDQVENDRLLRVSAQKKMNITIDNSVWSAWSATAVLPAGLANYILGPNVPSVAFRERLRARQAGTPPTQSNGTVSTKDIPHPRTTVRCAKPPREFNDNMKSTDVIYHVRDDGTSLGSLGNLSAIVDQVHGQGSFGIQSYRNRTLRYQYFSPVWLASPEPGSVASIGIFISWYSNATTPQPLDQLLAESTSTAWPLSVITCNVLASYITAPAVVAMDKGRLLATQTDTVLNLAFVPARNITLNVTGIDMLGSSAFTASGELKKTPLSPDPYAVELAAALTLGISNIPARGNYTMEYGGNETNSLSLTADKHVFERRSTLYAYGYTTNSTSVRLALAVILAYCIVTIAFLIYILVTGYTSTAWNSAIELVALALQSRNPEYPGHTAVGIDSLHTLNQGVGIRVNKDDELELVFASDRDLDSRGLRKIERNVVY